MPRPDWLLLSLALISAAGATERPIWGILSEPNMGAYPGYPADDSFINADYVKWLEAAGARVAPIFYDGTRAELEASLRGVNGLLFPGGMDIINHTAYYNASRYLFRRAIELNQRGDHFPVHGTCLGFELLCTLVDRGDISVLSRVDAENISLPLSFVSPPWESRLLSLLTPRQVDVLSSQGLTENFHHWGVTVQTWRERGRLQDFFRLVSTSKDRQGVEFASTVESVRYPVTATQWHPERNLFEWGPAEDINHSLEATEIMQLVADFLVHESKKSDHSFGSPEEEAKQLIYNHPITYTGKHGRGTPQVYFFQSRERRRRRA